VRREERALIGWYEELVGRCLDGATPENMDLAREILALPDQIRGYEQTKLASARQVKALAGEKLAGMAQRQAVPAE
jgi:indolepyruvate ferredoxin oxidoreductase